MKGIVRLSVILSLCLPLAKADAGSKDEQSKQLYNTANAIGPQQKPELLSFQQITHYGDKFQPEQIVYQQRFQPTKQHLQQAVPYQHQQEPMINKQILIPQHQPTPIAMVIIAQPAYIPASMLQNGNVAQQLINYFHGNSQARFIPIRLPQQPLQQYAPAPLQSQHTAQYVQYQPQEEIAQPPPSAPAEQAQSSQVYSHEALPTPQALISHQRIVPHHYNQQNVVEGRSLQYNIQHQQQEQQQIQYNQYQQSQPQQTEQFQSQNSEEHQLQPLEQQPSTDYQKPQQLTDISQLAQQAAQHFLMNGGLQSGSRTAPAIITGLEHFSPEQQEKIKKQLGVHFGSPLKPLNLGGVQDQGQQVKKTVTVPNTKYYHDHKQRLKTEKFVPSIEVKDGEITQSTSGSGKM